MQEARFVIEDIAPHVKEYKHRLMDYNNDPKTTFADIQNVFRLIEQRINQRLREVPSAKLTQPPSPSSAPLESVAE